MFKTSISLFYKIGKALFVTLQRIPNYYFRFMNTNTALITEDLKNLADQLEGDLHLDNTIRTLYATDASAYREMPLGVAIPKNEADLKKIIAFAIKNKISVIPRTAGTSLAGQVVGSGMVVDVSKHFNKILEVNQKEHWVRVQPGVIRDELNMAVKQYGLYFGPETSTANRAMMGGMVGNNSCGSNSIVYGSAREHTLEVKAILSDGSEATFNRLSLSEYQALVSNARQNSDSGSLLDQIYLKTDTILSSKANQEEIRKNFPKPSITRRNTGYALDMLLHMEPFQQNTLSESLPFNMCSLIAGSEGTLCFLTEIKVNLVPLPPKTQGLLCIHCDTIDEALRATILTLKYQPNAVELIDNYVLACAAANKEQKQNAAFVKNKSDGSYPAILVVDLSRETTEEVTSLANELTRELQSANMGFYYPLLFGDETKKIWTLRKAGLGLLANIPGDEKAVAVIEDTAVDVYDQPNYIRDFNEILEQNGMSAVHYAHAGTGEIHLRPIINLKTKEGHQQFRLIAEQIADLVKKYDGSLSGEHGDGRLRGEFIPKMVGEHNYGLFKEIKKTWDPNNLFNPGKIVDTAPMDTFLRYEPDHQTPEFKTYFRFQDQNILQHAEQCNGSGDCRKTELSGGTMCPSFMATRNEKDTTRARANILREMLTNSPKENRFDNPEIKEVFDLCLACKGCKGECPSNVDVAKLKMEFLQQYQDVHGIPMRSWLVGNFSKMSGLASYAPWAYNLIFKNAPLRKIANKIVGFHPDRTIPLLHSITLSAWWKKQANSNNTNKNRVYLFCDEFTNYNDVEIGIKAIKVLNKLGYEVIIPDHKPSGRPQLSKGLLKDAKLLAEANVKLLRDIISSETPLIGLEPSAILTFRDEYPDLVSEELIADAKKLAENALQFDEFMAREIDQKRISKLSFTKEKRLIKLHGHCQQKAIASMVPTKKMLSLPENYQVQLIPSGCCGMAGSFGYEEEHYDLSMQIGELVLFPTVRQLPEEVIIAAPGTSCRHQIHDGTGRKALHPAEILFEALV